MKNSLSLSSLALALAALCAAGPASAQSSVTIFGVVDVGITRLSGDGTSRVGVSTGGANISRWGFRGTFGSKRASTPTRAPARPSAPRQASTAVPR
jgi:hypothetical protein